MDSPNINPKQNTKPVPNQPSPKTSKTPFKKFNKILSILLFLGAFLLIGTAGYFLFFQLKNKKELNLSKKTTQEISKSGNINQPASVFASNFAVYKKIAVKITPEAPSYKVNKDLSNITNKDEFTFSETAQNLLAKNAFAVIPANNKEFFSIYEDNRYERIPSFITTDSILHNYHLMFDHILKRLEEKKLIPELKMLNKEMLSSTIEQYNILKGTEWENCAKRNIGFFVVASKLLDSNTVIPAVVENEVKQELVFIEAHQEIKKSPVMNIGSGKDILINTPQGLQSLEALKEDYSQYIPRGHYDKTDELKAYFKAMMWYGRLTFRLKNDDEIKSALLITLSLNKGENYKIWDKIYEPINFFVGKSDDITYYQFKDLSEKVYGKKAILPAVVQNKDKFNSFIELAKQLDPPKINSMPIFQKSIQSDKEKEIKGFRFMGQRFTIDASIFQRLVTREVGRQEDSCANAPFDDGRMLPKGLDIPAAMGSDEAAAILKEQGEFNYACYPENMAKMKEYISGLKTDIWTQNLYWGWLYSLLPLTTDKEEGYPTFMQNSAWLRKDINTYLGNWTELKHDTILYAKQVYAEFGGGGPEEKKDYRGYVEPNPYVYARLASLLKMTSEGLESRCLLTEDNKENIGKMEQLALSLKVMAEKELNNVSLSEKEYDLIKSYGGQLEHFWIEAFRDEGIMSRSQLDDRPAAIVADVATDPNGYVLEEGTGHISEIYVVVPVEGKLRIAKGGVYSYYEFSWPLSDRLTDAKWRELLKSSKAPELPDWTNAFMAK